jgi:pimeloyl-ACP methyl ester carboxylesterase
MDYLNPCLALVLIAGVAGAKPAVPDDGDDDSAVQVAPGDDGGGATVTGDDRDDVDETIHVATVDHFVRHISTVPANAGQRVKLFLRERFQGEGDDVIDDRDDVDDRQGGNDDSDHRRAAVLMVTGATTPALPEFDLRFGNYDWMAFLARAGFDVFALELTGYGSSPRPEMEDPCNASLVQQLRYLIPNPLSATCSPSFPFLLTTPDSDRDEIDSAVNYIRKRRHLDRINLIGWSRGGARVGSYAAHHPEKVERMVLLAPNYGRSAPDGPPPTLPLPGAAIDAQGSADFFSLWDPDVKCVNQFDPAVRGPITGSILASDPLGSTWGTAGVRRAPGLHGRATNFWGWNAKFAAKVTAPTLVIHGDVDHVVGESTQTGPLDQDLKVPHVYLTIACASHFLAWENRHTLLHRASAEWLRTGTFAGVSNGKLHVDPAGVISTVP